MKINSPNQPCKKKKKDEQSKLQNNLQHITQKLKAGKQH